MSHRAIFRIAATLIMAGLILTSASCRKQAEESDEYLDLLGSNWGLGVTLGMSRESVESVLSEPQYEIEARNKLSTDLIWLPEQTDAHGLKDSQLRLSISSDDELIWMMCIRKLAQSEDEVVFDPPFLLKPAAGCTIGSLKTDFVEKLGPPTSERSDSLIWDHQSLEGNRLRITAVFEMDESLGTAVCYSIAVQTGKSLGESLAEEKKKEVKIY